MKKIIALLIIFNVLFVTNQVLAVFLGPITCGGKIYSNTNDIGYKQCLEDEAKKEQEAKEVIYNGRVNELSQYSDFFGKVGVSLTIDTSSEQYTKWLGELKEAKNDYIKEQENQLKIKELEERINNLESKPAIIEKVITTKEEVVFPRNKEEVIKPTTTNDKKIAKPVIKQESKKEIIEEKPTTIIESPTISETPAIPIKRSLFHRVLNWLKSLI